MNNDRTRFMLYQRQIGGTLNAFDLKLTHVYKNSDLKKFGFNKPNPTYTLDVNSNVNVTDDYYINEERYLPTGTILPFAGSTVPGQYWLFCQGQSLSIETYSKLFSVIGYTYGGDGEAGVFNLPDLRGRVPIGSGTGTGLSTRTLAATGGAETHTLSINEMPSHTHGYIKNTNDQSTDNAFATESAADNADLPATTDPTGGGQPHNNMQPFIVINYVIRI